MRNPFPTACAMICEHPRERESRGRIVDDAVNFRGLKKCGVDQVRADRAAPPERNVDTGKRVALIGGGYMAMDAARLGIANRARIRARGRRGGITTAALVGRKASQGETWMPFHFPGSPVDRLTHTAPDASARIPEYKECAIQLEKLSGGER